MTTYRCPCGRTFKSKGALSQHRRFHPEHFTTDTNKKSVSVPEPEMNKIRFCPCCGLNLERLRAIEQFL